MKRGCYRVYLHHDREQFVEAINLAVYKTGLEPAIIEKDYYVTMVLKKLFKLLVKLSRNRCLMSETGKAMDYSI